MKPLAFTSLFGLILAATGFGAVGDNEKQIEALYGKPGKDLGVHGDVHQIGYMSGGFMILVDYVNGISKREGFANPDTSRLTTQNVEQVLRISAPEGTSWRPAPATGADESWQRSDGKAIAIFPVAGIFLFVQDADYVPPK
jgi:hypothetical protein